MPGNPAVLVVDDNVEHAEDLAEVLALEGLDVDYAAGGRAAIERLAARHYDLVVTDMRMPEVSGLDLLSHVKSTRPSAPVVVMTAFTREERLDEARARGAVAVFEKPIDL